MTGETICIECNHISVSVAPIGTKEMECSECGTEKKVWRYTAKPETVWQCDCGNQHFYLDPDGAMCARCGTRQVFD